MDLELYSNNKSFLLIDDKKRYKPMHIYSVNVPIYTFLEYVRKFSGRDIRINIGDLVNYDVVNYHLNILRHKEREYLPIPSSINGTILSVRYKFFEMDETLRFPKTLILSSMSDCSVICKNKKKQELYTVNDAHDWYDSMFAKRVV